MPRRPANVNQADVQRIIRACKREDVPVRITLQPNGAAVFEMAAGASQPPATSALDQWRAERGAG